MKSGKATYRKQIIYSLVLLLFSYSMYAQVPTISTFSPLSGPVGTTVVITGTNFSNTPTGNIVYFGGAKATVSAATSTSITVAVPLGATYHPITVTTANLTAFSDKFFTVTFCSGSITTGSFATMVGFTSGIGPNSVVSGDIDGDGKIDLVTANRYDNTVSVLRNTSTIGAISFAVKVDFATGTDPFNASISDIDGDGMQDIIVTNRSSNSISILRNTSTTGAVSFATKIDFATGTDPMGLSINDLDEDGKADIAVGNTNNVSIFRNTSSAGIISFDTKMDFATGTGASYVSLTDLDGDGKADMAVTNGLANNISIFRNTGTPGTISFDIKTDYSMISHPTVLQNGDIDGDGKTDLVVADGFGGAVSILRNTSSVGNISFAVRSDVSAGGGPYSVSVGDLNGDGKPDPITGNMYDYTVSVLRNTSTTGNITFNTGVELSSGSDPLSTTLADIDGDGKMELITGNYSDGNVAVYRNLVTGSASTVTSFTPASSAAGATVTITGTGFTDSTAVSFGGIAATSFSVVSPTSITAVVGAGASGSISVTSPCGVATLAGFTFISPATVMVNGKTYTKWNGIKIVKWNGINKVN